MYVYYVCVCVKKSSSISRFFEMTSLHRKGLKLSRINYFPPGDMTKFLLRRHDLLVHPPLKWPQAARLGRSVFRSATNWLIYQCSRSPHPPPFHPLPSPSVCSSLPPSSICQTEPVYLAIPTPTYPHLARDLLLRTQRDPIT